MATERQEPTGTSASANVTGDHLDLDDDPDSPDGNWATADADGTDSDIRVSFDTPTGDPTTGAGLQEIRAWVRRSATGGNDPQCRIEVWDGGSAITGGVGSDTTITSDSGQLLTLTWDATNLATADGSGVEVRLYGTRSGGGPSVRRSVDFGAAEWNVDFTPASQTITHTALDDSSLGTHTVAATYGITHTALDDSSLGTHAVANVGAAQDITHVALVTSESFGSHTVAATYGITHTALASSESFGSHTVAPGAVDLAHIALATSESFGTHSAAATYGITHTALASSEALGSHTVAAAYGITHTALASSESFPLATVAAGAVQITHTALASSGSFGSHAVDIGDGDGDGDGDMASVTSEKVVEQQISDQIAVGYVETTITEASLTAAAATEALDVDKFPANAYPLYAEIAIGEYFTGGVASAMTVQVGDAGDPNGLLAAISVFSTTAKNDWTVGTPGVEAEFGSTGPSLESAYSPQVLFTCTGDDVADVTAGFCSVRIHYRRYMAT